MPISRRYLLGVGRAAVVAVGGIAAWRLLMGTAATQQLPPPAPALQAAATAPAAPPAAQAGDQRMTERAIGKPDAPVTVIEFSSLTCPHCAAFARDTMPQIKSQLIDTGKLRMVFGDFPLDQVALTAAMVARSLPPERYEPFCAALFASQDRWAFARGVNSTDELAKMAALAGLSRDAFNTAIADQPLRDWILKQQDEAGKTYQVDSTPTFIFNGPAEKNHREAGARPYDDFARLVAAAAG
jgi:protein-disulfide isomerase